MAKDNSRRTLAKKRARSIGRLARILRAHLPEISEQYHVKSLGVFGSYVRYQNKLGSDLDVLVEYSQPISLHDDIQLQERLSNLLGVKVDLVPRKQLKPFVGKRILREVVWLQQNGVATHARLPRRGRNGSRSAGMPKREYLDFLNDIVQAMQFVQQYIAGVTREELIANIAKHDAVVFRVEVIGEAAKQIPQDVKSRYPEIDWKEMAGMRDRLTHGYWAIDNKVLWDVATIDIPRDRPSLESILQQELKRRAVSGNKPTMTDETN